MTEEDRVKFNNLIQEHRDPHRILADAGVSEQQIRAIFAALRSERKARLMAQRSQIDSQIAEYEVTP